MSDTKSDYVKPSRSTGSRTAQKLRPTLLRTNRALHPPMMKALPQALSMRPHPRLAPFHQRRPVRQPAPTPSGAAQTPPTRIDPNEHGFDAETNSRYEEIKKGNTYITELQHMTMAQLQKAAKDENIPREEYIGLKKQDLIFRILKERVKPNGLMFGEGTLEVLPDGFGFLRSPDYNYLPCPDDIYISPIQIRRFGLRTGSRRRRPDSPAEGERALLRAAPRRGDQLPRPGHAHAEGRLRRPDAAAPRPAAQARNRPRTN